MGPHAGLFEKTFTSLKIRCSGAEAEPVKGAGAETLTSQAIDNSIVDKFERPSPRLLTKDVVDDAIVLEIEKEGFPLKDLQEITTRHWLQS